MKILMYSTAFQPSIGGLESVVSSLAQEMAKLGHKVRVITTTRGPVQVGEVSYIINRNPSPLGFIEQVRWCDIFIQHNVSLKGIWPLALIRRPLVFTHHGWYSSRNGSLNWRAKLKLWFARRSINIAVSQAVADHLKFPCTVIPNPYRNDLFRTVPDIPKTRDIVFLGRLVSDKGCELALDALAALSDREISPTMTVIGSGPEEHRLREQALRLGLADRVIFTGPVVGEDLVCLLNRHRIMVIPSLMQEGFGLVALEGIACGCIPVGSIEGGLAEAIGPCGETFPSGDMEILTALLERMLKDPGAQDRYLAEAPKHLAKHHPMLVAEAYLQVFRSFGNRNK